MPERHTIAQCEGTMFWTYPNHAQAPDGEQWTCTCGRVYEHFTDGVSGGTWLIVLPGEADYHAGR